MSISIDGYNVISINDDRINHKVAIHKLLKDIPYMYIDAIDGKTADIPALLKQYRVRNVWGNAKRGELGVWFSVLEICKFAAENNKTILVFEDDAIITSDNFMEDLNFYLSKVPDDADAFSVLVPKNQHMAAYFEWTHRPSGQAIQHPDIAPPYRVNPWVARAYQGYSFVSMVYTPAGGQNILDLAKATGFTMPMDCWLFEQAQEGELNVYTLTPDCATLVDINWVEQEPTTIGNSGVWDERKDY